MLPWLILHCASPLHSYLFLKGSLGGPRLRASNEVLPRARVPRAGGRPGCPFPTWPLPSPSCYDIDPMSTRSESGKTNLAAIAVLVGLIITGVWVWKRLSFDTQGRRKGVGSLCWSDSSARAALRGCPCLVRIPPS